MSHFTLSLLIRVSSHSYIPDLETQETFGQRKMHQQQTSGPGLESSTSYHHQPSSPNHLHHQSESVLEPAPPTSLVIKTALIEPHPQVLAKKKEVLHDLAVQKHAVQEAKVWVQLLLLSFLCICFLVYLQAESF